MIIDSLPKLIRHLKTLDNRKSSSVKVMHKRFSVVNKKTFKEIEFKNFSWSGQYRNCKFSNCSFEKIFGHFLEFKNCKFVNCKFENSRFSHFENIISGGDWDNLQFEKCEFRYVQFDEGEMYNIFFDECSFNGLKIDYLETTINVNFFNCTIEESFIFTTHFYENSEIYTDEILDLFFDECRIDDTMFIGGDLRNSVFLNASIYKGVFIDCRLNRDTIIMTKESKYPNYVSLDFQTILKSDDLNFSVLRKYFNIHTPDIKSIASGVTSEINFRNVFISYSFKDNPFARLLNDQLSENGVKTFLWEKDAPGGEYLADIMEENIKKHDRILFIASQNSIKSKACQFEISEARKK